MKEKIIVKVAWCGKNFSASLSKNVPGVVLFTAKTFSELQKEARVSLDFHLEGMQDDGDKVPQWWLDGEYEFEYEYADTATLLQVYGEIVSLASISRVSGINQQLLSHYANGLKKPRPQQRQRIVEGIHALGRQLLSAV